MKIVDAVVDGTGKATVLGADGCLYDMQKPGISYQNVPVSKRPDHIWTKVEVPQGKITKLLVGYNAELWAVISGVLHKRLAVAVPPFGRSELVWRPVEITVPGEVPEPAVPTRTLIQTWQGAGSFTPATELTGGAYALDATSVVSLEKFHAGKWVELERKANRFFAGDGDLIRIGFGSDGGRATLYREEN